MFKINTGNNNTLVELHAIWVTIVNEYYYNGKFLSGDRKLEENQKEWNNEISKKKVPHFQSKSEFQNGWMISNLFQFSVILNLHLFLGYNYLVNYVVNMKNKYQHTAQSKPNAVLIFDTILIIHFSV